MDPARYPVARGLIEGAIDLHIHAEPDLVPRKTNCIDLVSAARALRMSGFLIKDHVTLTGDRALILNKIYNEVTVYGSVVLNYPVGGLNPSTVEAALNLGCRVVFMPTYCAGHQIKKWGKPKKPHGYPFPDNEDGISIIDDRGKLVPSVHDILDLIKASGAVLASGHLSSEEIFLLVREARRMKLPKIIITHASMKLIDLSAEEQEELIRLGAFIEHCYVATTPFLSARGETSCRDIAHQIRETGYERCIMSTDLGQTVNPHPVEGFLQFITAMVDEGFAENEIVKMINENPKTLLEG